MQHRIGLTISDNVAEVALDRPEKMNAIDADMFWALAEVGNQLKNDRRVRAVVLHGHGRAFCAGLDVEGLDALTSGRQYLPFTDLTRRSHGIANWAQHIVWQWRELPVPVIAAVHGAAFGGGFQLALGADMRYASEETKFSIIEGKWGIVPDMAGTQLMRHLAREDIVRELTYTARIFTARDAHAYGFVTRVTEDPLAAARTAAREIASRSPDAVRAMKRLLNLAVACDAATGLLAETDEQRRLLGTPNQLEAVRAGREQRAPRFDDPA